MPKKLNKCAKKTNNKSTMDYSKYDRRLKKPYKVSMEGKKKSPKNGYKQNKK